MFSQLPVEPISECTRTDTLNYEPNLFFDGQSQTNRHSSIDRHSRRGKPFPPPFNFLALVPSPPTGRDADRKRNGGGLYEEEYRVSAKEREEVGGSGGVLSFYFDSNLEEEDSLFELDNDSDLLEDEWGEGREDGEDVGKEKNIKIAQAVFTMTCLDLVLDKIKPNWFLHLDVEGWNKYALYGDRVAPRGVEDTCFVICEVWYERDRNSKHLGHRYANGFGPTCDDIFPAMAEHPIFKGSTILLITIGICDSASGRGGGGYSGGGQMTMMHKKLWS